MRFGPKISANAIKAISPKATPAYARGWKPMACATVATRSPTQNGNLGFANAKMDITSPWESAILTTLYLHQSPPVQTVTSPLSSTNNRKNACPAPMAASPAPPATHAHSADQNTPTTL